MECTFDERKQELEAECVVKPSAADRLIEFFKASAKLENIGAMEARKFRKWLEGENRRDKPRDEAGKLLKKGLAINTVRRRTGQCKQFFSQAVKDGLIDRNPFAGLAASVKSNKERQHYVPLEVFAKLLEKAPNARWRTLLVLSRIEAVRTPSEVAGLRWRDISWKTHRFTVLSPKTEHHQGKQSRIIPLFPAIEKELRKLAEEADVGAE